MAEEPAHRLSWCRNSFHILQVEVVHISGQALKELGVVNCVLLRWEQLLAEALTEELVVHILKDIFLDLNLFLCPNIRKFCCSLLFL